MKCKNCDYETKPYEAVETDEEQTRFRCQQCNDWGDIEKQPSVEQSEFNDGLSGIQQAMIEAVKEQAAALLASEIATQRRHEEEMENKRKIKEQNVWLAACTAYMSSGSMASTSGALESADKVMKAFNEKFAR